MAKDNDLYNRLIRKKPNHHKDALSKHGYPGNRTIPRVESREIITDLPGLLPITHEAVKGSLEPYLSKLLPGNIAVRNCISLQLSKDPAYVRHTNELTAEWGLYAGMHPARITEMSTDKYSRPIQIPRSIDITKEPLVIPDYVESLTDYIISNTPVTGRRLPGNIVAIVSELHFVQIKQE